MCQNSNGWKNKKKRRKNSCRQILPSAPHCFCLLYAKSHSSNLFLNLDLHKNGVHQPKPNKCETKVKDHLFSLHPVIFFYLFIYLYLFIFKIFIVIQLQLYAFSPHPSTPPQLNPPPSPTSTLPLDFVHVSFIVVPVIPSPHCPLPTPPWLLLDCS